VKLEELSTYGDILEIYNRINTVELRKKFPKTGKIFQQKFEILKRGVKVHFNQDRGLLQEASRNREVQFQALRT